jgi:hypothetical protein
VDKVTKIYGVKFSAAELKILERLAKVITESDDRSGRPWVVGDLVHELEPAGRDGITTGSTARLDEIATRVRSTRHILRTCRTTSTAWPAARRHAGVSWSVFQDLASLPTRFQLLDALVREHGAEGVTVDIARKAARGTTTRNPVTTNELLEKILQLIDRLPKRLRGFQETKAKQAILALESKVYDEEAVG